LNRHHADHKNKRLKMTFYGDKFCADSCNFIVVAMDNNTGDRIRRQSPQPSRSTGSNRKQIFKNLANFTQKNNAF